MATTQLTFYGSNARQIKPAVVNLFSNNNNVDRLEFTMENYNQGNVDLSTLDPYAICYGSKFVGGLDEVKLESEVTEDGVLRVYWDLTLMTLTSSQTIQYQIVFKNAEGQVWTSHNAIIFANESLTADEEIVAKYPTILKQMEGRIETKTDEAVNGVIAEATNNVSTEVNKAITQINNMADSFDASVVYIPYGEMIPTDQRVSNRLYYQYTDADHTKGRFEDSNGTVLIVDESGVATYAPIGTIISVNASSNYVPDGCLSCDGEEYNNAMFEDLWDNWLCTGFEWKSQYEGLIGYESLGRPSVENVEMYFNTDCDHVTIDEGIDWSLCFNLYDVTTSQKLCSVYNSGMGSWIDVVVEGGELKMTLFGSLSSIETVSTGDLYVKREDEMIWYSLNGSEWEGVFSVGSGVSQFGSEDLRGHVDLSKSYINGVQLATEGVLSLLNTCSYSEYEQDLATNGQCSKFAVDVEKETFKVPTINDDSNSLKHFVIVANGQINESMIDWSKWASSIKGKANTDLSNLSSEGQAKFDEKVNKAGDTMTGVLKFNVNKQYSDPICLVCPEMDWTTAPTRNTNCGIHFYDKNGKLGPYFLVVQNEGSTQNYFSMGYNSTDDPNFMGFNFPKATSKPTTTSTATFFKPAVVTQNYLNGSSWYRVWSDGFIEQGGAISNQTTPISITFAKTFTNVNSVRVLFETVSTGNAQAICLNGKPTVSGFSIFRYGGGFNIAYTNWYACGY